MNTSAADPKHVTRLLASWAGLLALLALTFGCARLPLGRAGLWVALAIAAAKAALVLWIFMDLRASSRLVRTAAVAGAYWLTILFLLGLADVMTRL